MSDIVSIFVHKNVDTADNLYEYRFQMRDDIHKSAPVSRAWRSFMKHCGREADRKERAAASADRALAQDCKNELSPGFLNKLRVSLSDTQKKLFTEGLAESCASGAVRQGGQVMEQAVVAHLGRREACGQSGPEAIVGAVADAISGRKNAELRAMEGHWLKKGGSSSLPAVQAAKHALQKLSSTELASKILSGEFDAVERKRTKGKMHLDENLLDGGGTQ